MGAVTGAVDAAGGVVKGMLTGEGGLGELGGIAL